MKSRVALLFLFISIFALSCGASRKLATTRKVESDTVAIQELRVVNYKPLASLNIEVGETLTVPGLDLVVTRINTDQAVVKAQTKVVTRQVTEVQLVPTKIKQINRSKDKSVRDSNINSKVKDKSQTGSNNKQKKAENEKVKQNNKQVKRSFQWWLLLFFIPLVIFWRHLKNRFNK